MHPALFVDEILRPIFHQCLDEDTSPEDYRWQLYQLARTCRAFTDPALDLLWTRLPSIKPIMALVPGTYNAEGVYCLEREMTESEQAKFMMYAQRVKYLAQHQHFPLHGSISALAPFCVPNTRVLLLPNLIETQLSSSGFTNSSSCLALSPKLQTLRIRLSQSKVVVSSEEALRGFLSLARGMAPELTNIHIRGRLSEQTNAVIASMSSLKSFTCQSGSSLSSTTIAALCAFPSLTSLNIRADHITSADLPASTPIFTALEELTIRARPALIEWLLNRLAPGVLRRLSLDVIADRDSALESQPDWPSLIRHVAVAGRTSLRELAVEHHPEHEDAPASPDEWIAPALLAPLLSLSSLRSVTLDLNVPHALDDGELARLVRAWPALTRLALHTPPACFENEQGWVWRPRATFGALVEIAREAPKLERLEVSIDVSSRTSLAALTKPSSGVPSALGQPALRDIWLATPTRLAGAEGVSKFLSTLFPGLEHVNGDVLA